MIHHEGEQTQQELIDMSMRNVYAVEKLSSHHPRVTKGITDIFRFTHKRILIEGAPGIGKTVLAKEIAYCWANGEILTDTKLFLLVIRDPNLHCVNSITELVHYLNNDYLSDSEVEVAADELRKSKGSGIAFVIDGYDECPCDSKLKIFVDKLVQKKYLPLCMVVITSRPTASLLLRHLVNQRIEILGLAKKERDQYISESLKGSPEMKIKLQEYLKRQPIINSLIYVPLHLAVLLYLFKQDSLPETLTELNEYFIIHTIYRHLTKQGLEPVKVAKLIYFPRHILDIIYQLSKLTFKGLQDSQLVFTYDEVKKVCPEVDDTPGAINGLGLLQAVQQYCLKGAGKTTSLNFLHFTMQEYLAALHVSTLPSEQKSVLIKNTFWDHRFNFMWMMYVGIVGIQLAGLTDLVNFAKSDVKDHNMLVKKYLFLFQCYLEIKETNFIPKEITSVFSDGNIDLHGQTLLPHHIMSLTVFMMRSTTQWKSLNLNACSIGCNDIDILENFFTDFQERLKYISLRYNHLTSLGNTHLDQNQTITDNNSGILQSVESLDLSYNQFSDSGIAELFCALKFNKTLRTLNISSHNIIHTVANSDMTLSKSTDEGVKKLIESVEVNTTLQNLDISHNAISDDSTLAISDCLKINSTLCKLSLSCNEITDEGAKGLAEAIKVNTTLQELNISKNWISKEGVMRIVEACTINRTLHKLVCTHNNLSKSGLATINGYIRKENAVQIFIGSWNSLCIKNTYLAFKTIFQLSYLQQKVQSDDDNVDEELWFIDEITDPKYLRKFLQCCLDVQHVNLTNTMTVDQGLALHKWKIDFRGTITDDQMLIFCHCLMNNSTLTALNLSSNNITDEGAKRLAEAIKVNTTLQELNISMNKITDEGAKRLAEAIQINTTLQELNISMNKITDEGAKRLAEAIQINTTLQELNISKNWISKEGVMRIVEACTINRTLHKLVCTHNNLSKSGLAAINEYIRKENAVQIFVGSWNSLCSKNNKLAFKTTFQLSYLQQKVQSDDDNIDEELWFIDEITDPKYLREFLQCCLDVQHVNLTNTITDNQMLIFCHCLMNNSTLTELNLSNNNITDEGAKRLAEAIKVNTTLQELNISMNKITDEGAKRLAEAIQINTTLQELNISMNKITDKGAKRLAEAIQINTTLQELNISKNWISKEGVMRIVEACTINRTLHKLVCTHNNLSKSGLAAINEYIRKENAVQIFVGSWNSLCSKNNKLAFKTIFQLSYLQQKVQSGDDNIDEELWFIDEITDPKYLREFLQCCLDVQHVNLTNTITDNQMLIFCHCLMNNSTLTELNLSNNNITDEGAKRLAEAIKVNTTLQELNISMNKITDEGAKRLAEAIQINTTLQELNISMNKITDEGVKRLAEAIQINTTLQELNISMNKITDEGAKKLAEAIQINTTLQELNISKNWISKEEVMRIVEACTINRTLHKLVCTHNNLSKSGLAAINEYIRKENALQVFDASWNSVIASSRCRSQLVIPTFQSLRWSLDSWENNLFDYNKQVWFVNDSIWKNIPCRFTHDSLLELKFPSYSIMPNVQVDIMQGVMQVDTLQKLDISYNRISDDEVIAFSECLKTNTTLIELNMSYNDITCKGASVIAEAIQLNTTLQKLNISYNRISEDEAIAFSECLKTKTALIDLNMSWNGITRKGASVIAEAIHLNTTLQKLNISYNRISDDGAIAFSECLKTNTALIDLNMSWNDITCKGASVIAEAIQLNTTLQKLNISHSKISDDGAIAFIECLKTNTTLIELDMSGNNITCKGASVIAEAIQLNTTLQKLNISYNRISNDGAIAFSECLKTNTALIDLDMVMNNIISYKFMNRANKPHSYMLYS